MRKLLSSIIFPTFIFFVIIIFHSCYYDSEEYLFPDINSSCDTLDITYNSTVQPVLQSYCYSCHNNSNANALGGGIKLEDYNDVKIVADNDRLLGTISHEAGYSPMPKGGSKLDDCTISQIELWVNSGAPNN